MWIQSLWNPFRDWNVPWVIAAHFWKSLWIQSLWNPFRDWNLKCRYWQPVHHGFKASETLLGIETTKSIFCALVPSRIQSLWNPFRDWNFAETAYPRHDYSGFKASETLLGIETSTKNSYTTFAGFKASETLLGIETDISIGKFACKNSRIQSLWNPFRDWN